MNKKTFVCLFALLMLLACAAAVLPAAADAPAKEYGNYISGPHILRGESIVSVMLTGEKRDAGDPEAWKKEIRCFSYDPENGVFETGEGREPGGEAEWVRWLEDGCGYTVRLLKPGKYVLSGVPVYVMDLGDERQAALLEELDQAADKADRETQLETGTNLYRWLQKRVKADLPKDQPELAEICADPVNALLTGYAAPEAYPELLRLILSAARVKTVLVDGTRTGRDGETEWVWAACELDGKWLWADPALDAGKTARFGKEESDMEKDHVLSEGAERFTQRFIRSAHADILLACDYELEARLRGENANEGYGISLLFIDGPLYSLGPSGPVTLHFCSDQDIGEVRRPSDPGNKQDIIRSYFYQRLDWNSEFNYFYDPLPKNATDYKRSRNITTGDVEILDYDREHDTLTVVFRTPGLYKFSDDGDNFCVLDPDDPDQVEIARLLDEARDIAPGKTDRETAKKLQDWVASKLKYDNKTFQLMKKWTLGLTDPEKGDEYKDEYGLMEDAAQDPYGALSNGAAVCGGYANLYAVLLRNAGIPAFRTGGYISRSRMGHAWDIVRMDGRWLYADPTWDDNGRESSTRYFAQDYARYVKHHDEFGGKNTVIGELFENTVYGKMTSRFDTRYGVKLEIPDSLKVLPGDVSAYGFPAKDPSFIRFAKFAIDNNHVEYGFGQARVAITTIRRNMNGAKQESFSDYELATCPESGQWRKDFTSLIFEMTVQDYPGGSRPVKKPSVRQEYVWARTVQEVAKLSYSVPMKRNEIRGYSEKSFRTYTYDGDMNKTAMSWELEKDGTVLTITASFGADGKTERVSVLLTPPAGGNGIGWETAKDGHITSLRLDDGEDTYLLEEMNDTWTQNRRYGYRTALLKKYPSISAGEPLEEGIHLYRFSKDKLITATEYAYLFTPNLYGGQAIATRDELFFWDAEGRLQVNPDARDLNGNPITVSMGTAMDLSMAVRIPIAD